MIRVYYECIRWRVVLPVPTDPCQTEGHVFLRGPDRRIEDRVGDVELRVQAAGDEHFRIQDNNVIYLQAVTQMIASHPDWASLDRLSRFPELGLRGVESHESERPFGRLIQVLSRERLSNRLLELALEEMATTGPVQYNCHGVEIRYFDSFDDEDIKPMLLLEDFRYF